MSDKTIWDKTKTWVSKNRTISGAAAGFAAGSVVPGLGNVFGAIVGAGIGFVSAKEQERHHEAERPPPPLRPLPSEPFRKG